MALPPSSLTVPEIVRDVPAPIENVSVVGVLAPLVGTVICWSGTLGIPPLNTPTRYVPGTTLRVNAPEVFVCPPVPKPTSAPEELESGRANTPALDTALPFVSRTVPVMVLPSVESVKSLPVTDAVATETEMFGGGMNVNVGGGGGGAPGVKKASGIAGPTPTLYVVFVLTGIEYATAEPVSVIVCLENPLLLEAKTSTDVPEGPVTFPDMVTEFPPHETIMFFVRFVAETVKGWGAELNVTVEEALAKEPGSMPTM